MELNNQALFSHMLPAVSRTAKKVYVKTYMTYNLYQFNMSIYFAQIATAITESILTYKGTKVPTSSLFSFEKKLQV